MGDGAMFQATPGSSEAEVSRCTLCHGASLRKVLPLGEQPPANRFLRPDQMDAEERSPLSLGICGLCGTIQLVDRMPLGMVRPRFQWLRYNEPEGHLDDLAGRLTRLPGIDASSSFLGLSYKDQSTLDRLGRLGYSHTACVEAADLLGSGAKLSGIETLQAALSEPNTVDSLLERYGAADVLILRHVIEHAADARGLVLNLSRLLSGKGYLVLEFPDSERVFRANNHAFIWEEHLSYFHAGSLVPLAQAAAADIGWYARYPYPFEDSWVLALRFPKSGASPPTVDGAVDSGALLAGMESGLALARAGWRRRLEALRAANQRIAVFGAGHLAVKFINFLNLADLFDCVIDDHPGKCGLFMPGSHLPILPSRELLARDIRICVSALSPESELKVRAALPSYFQSGGQFIPAFSTDRLGSWE